MTSHNLASSGEVMRATATPAGECKRVADPLPPVKAERAGEDAVSVIARYKAGVALRDRQLIEVGGCADSEIERAGR